jgi:hypothetical protein
VVHSRSDAGRSVVGVAFGWDAGVGEGSATPTPKSTPRSWLGFFSRKAKEIGSVIGRRR